MVVKWSTYAPSTLAILVQIPQKKMKFPTKETKIGKIKRGRGFTFYSDNPTDTKNYFFQKDKKNIKETEVSGGGQVVNVMHLLLCQS